MTSSQPARGGLPSPGLTWQPGHTPYSATFGDIYFSREGGLAESRHVFLDGCGLPQSWRDADAFTIGELGFGTGLNFLATSDLWRRTRRPGAQLHYVAVEGYPLTRAEIADCLEAWRALRPLAQDLLRVYPEPQPGFHRLFPAPDVHLTLLYGEAALVLSQLEARVDAWFLDGFSPDRNPAMWRAQVFSEVARLSHKDTRLATYSAASEVRRGLDAAGFEMEKAPGFGTKREMLRGGFRGGALTNALQPWFAHAAPRTGGHAAIIGGGIAGTNVAHALRRRGWQTTIIDRRATLADEASGNPAGILMPRLTAAPNLDGRFYASAWRFALETLEEIGAPTQHGRYGTLQLATDETEAARQSAIIAAAPLAHSLLTHVDAAEASDIAGCDVPYNALYFPQGGWLAPRDVCTALARDSQLVLNASVSALHYGDGQWHVRGPHDETLMQADVVVLANALHAASLPITSWMPLKARRGQITLAPPTPRSAALKSVLTYGGYITPVHNGAHSIGATFDWVDTQDLHADPQVNPHDHARNLEELAQALPGLMQNVSAQNLSGRAGLRCTTLDHLALAGPVPDHAAYMRDFAELRHGHPWARYANATYQPGLYTLTGLGARGLVSAPLAAEMIASQITGAPWPMERDLGTALHPGRFLVRDLKRREA